MSEAHKNKPQDFGGPVAVPSSADEAKKWQEANASWWEANPMRYDWKATIPHREFSREFFEEIDKRFFSNAAEYLKRTPLPFDEFIRFNSLKDKDVLEIGVGNGSHAQLLASHAKTFEGIDLTAYAVQSTSQRLKVFDLPGKIQQMDAEKLEFPDGSFDFVWSWGVIHHSANTPQILKEIERVLRPGGEAVIMVYHRGWWNYYVEEVLWGITSGNLFKTKSLHKSVQLHTDGALARYYTFPEWRKAARNFEIMSIETAGPKTDVIPLPGGKLRNLIARIPPNSWNKFLARDWRMGSFLISRLKKR